MLVLAIDSAMNGCSVGLYDGAKKVALQKQSHEMSRGQAERLMPMIDDVIKAQGITYNDLDCIAVTKGPGAFTGMRIGLATARALGLALNVPVIGVDTFQAVLQTYLMTQSPGDNVEQYGVLLETKRKDFYFQLFESGSLCALTEPAVVDADGVHQKINAPTIIIGDAEERFLSESEKQNDYIRCKSLLLTDPIAVASYVVDIKQKKTNKSTDCNPLYIRAPDVSLSKRPVRKVKRLQ